MNCIQFNQVANDYKFSGNTSAGLNKEQRVAVSSILKMKEGSIPYLLFGPAGTGKTGTLVATIEEIVRSSNKFVLVCANSNNACDEIAKRLIGVLKVGEIFRMYAQSYSASKLDNNIKQCCNYYPEKSGGKFIYPSLSYLYQFRVLICTLLTAGHLMRARCDRDFDSTHFSYVIIDECAGRFSPARQFSKNEKSFGGK
ncbi:putative helicase MOV-10 [Sitodiplosis mosellana]|uniref:putative helicase MOV-10 n=1 Tax=Sitodiplosis mosellana TaxID=263140 RepID=UPI00244449AB|nr:putative helicase MOV-10 [Sitodiplosis mosellana]